MQLLITEHFYGYEVLDTNVALLNFRMLKQGISETLLCTAPSVFVIKHYELTNEHGYSISVETGIFLSGALLRPLLGLTQWVPRALSTEIKQSEREAGHSPLEVSKL
jgi:hypothetical protein